MVRVRPPRGTAVINLFVYLIVIILLAGLAYWLAGELLPPKGQKIVSILVIVLAVLAAIAVLMGGAGGGLRSIC